MTCPWLLLAQGPPKSLPPRRRWQRKRARWSKIRAADGGSRRHRSRRAKAANRRLPRHFWNRRSLILAHPCLPSTSDSPPSPPTIRQASRRARLFRLRKEGAFPPFGSETLLPLGDSRQVPASPAPFCDCRVIRSLIQF